MRKRTIRLGDVTDNFDSLRKPVKKTERVAGEFPYYGASGVVDHVDNYIFDGEYLLIAEDGENLRSRSTPIAFMAAGKFWVNNHAHVVRGNHLADTRFLNYLLAITDISGYLTGSAQPKLSRASMDSIQISLPDLDTQRAIAEVLGALDDKIAANNRTIKIGESLSTALLEGIPPSIPLANIVSQRRKTVNPSNLDVEATAHFSLPAFDDKKRPVYCRPDEIKSNKVLIDFPSVLMSKLNPRFPRIWSILNLPDSPALASTEFVVLTPKEISVPLLWAILSQRRFSLELATKVSGTSGSHQRVKPEDMLSSAVIDPNSVGQEAIGLINETAELLLKLGNENNQLSVLRDALLPQLMSGKIRVREAEAVVEDVL